MEALQQRIAEIEAILAAKDAEIAAKDARIRELEQLVMTLMAQVATLTKQVAELTEKLGRNSRNSHLPPSTDPPGSAGKPGGKPRSKGERKRGGQRGHRGARRELVPESQVNNVIDLYPAECENCWAALPEFLEVITVDAWHAKRTVLYCDTVLDHQCGETRSIDENNPLDLLGKLASVGTMEPSADSRVAL